MATRIVLCGASSTGKTTLASEWCSDHKDFEHIQEIARGIMGDMGITRDDLLASLKTEKKEVFFELQCRIMEKQNRRELATNGKPFISDRGPDPLAYVYERMGPEGLDRLMSNPATKECLQRYREHGSLVVVLCPLPSVTDDGFRMVPQKKEQEQFVEDICRLLKQYQVPYIYMNVTDRQERLTFLQQAASGDLDRHQGEGQSEKI